MEAVCRRVGRAADSVTLVAVSKTVPLAAVEAAWGAGARTFGENRVQEAEAKIRAFHPPGIAWHLVGHLQSNKAGRAVELFDLIHSVDDLELVRALARRAGARAKRQALLLQVNASGEAAKSGCAPEEAAALARCVLEAPALALRGLMTIGPMPGPGDDPEAARPAFRRLRALRDELERTLGVSLPELSMGMTGDLEVAIEEGATLIRVGTAIFGSRI